MWLFHYHRATKRSSLSSLYQTEKSLYSKICSRGTHHFSNSRGNQKSFFASRLGELDDCRKCKRSAIGSTIEYAFCRFHKSRNFSFGNQNREADECLSRKCVVA